MSSSDAAQRAGDQRGERRAALAASAVLRHERALEDVGIVFSPAMGQIGIDLERNRVEIGTLILRDDGIVEVVPCEGVSVPQHLDLMLQAEHVKLSGPREDFGWQYVDGLGWVAAVFEPL